MTPAYLSIIFRNVLLAPSARSNIAHKRQYLKIEIQECKLVSMKTSEIIHKSFLEI